MGPVIASSKEILTQIENLEGKKYNARKESENAERAIIIEEEKVNDLINKYQNALTAEEKEKEEYETLNSERDSILNGRLEEDIDSDYDAIRERSLKEEVFKTLEEKRKDLIEGEPCPLCGSIHHPYSDEAFIKEHNAENSLLEKEIKRIKKLKAALYNVDERIKKKEKSLNRKKEERILKYGEWQLNNQSLISLKKMKEDKDSDIVSINNEIKTTKEKLFSYIGEREIPSLELSLKSYEEKKAERDKCQVIINTFSIKEKGILETIEEKREEQDKKKKELDSLNALLSSLKEKREELFHGETGEERKRLQTKLALKKLSMEKAGGEYKEIEDEITTLTGQIKEIKESIASFEERENPYKDCEDLEVMKEEKEEERGLLHQEKGALTEALSINKENAERFRTLEKEIEKQKEVVSKWNDLNSLIGSSSGNKFMEIAQAYTFKELIKAANKRLRVLSDRYVLTYDYENKLDFSVIDTENDNNIRTAKGLSGGESFIVSLALSLGLSTFMAKDTKIESFFLDEGFGTLDENNLSKAIDALFSLKEEGKTIGIISHVSALKEAIPLQIRVEKKGVINGPGVS